MNSLEPCPCCNRMPAVGNDDDGAWVECSDCFLSTGYCDVVDDAIAEWNESAIEARKND